MAYFIVCMALVASYHLGKARAYHQTIKKIDAFRKTIDAAFAALWERV